MHILLFLFILLSCRECEEQKRCTMYGMTTLSQSFGRKYAVFHNNLRRRKCVEILGKGVVCSICQFATLLCHFVQHLVSVLFQ